MSDNHTSEQCHTGKPVNINISFNISRKQVMQSINPIETDQTYNLKNLPLQQHPLTNIKPRNQPNKPPKTPELAQTDRHIYSKDLEFVRPTEELKRKKMRKRSSGDYTADKTSNFPFYPVDLDKSLPTHKRGYTTSMIKKTTSGAKPKKQSSKIDPILKQGNTIPISALIDLGKKSQQKSLKIDKNLKNILNKLMNNQLSKRSLPLPSVPSKSKYNQSTSLTNRKISVNKSGRKRSSKSHIMTKQKPICSSQNINSSRSEFQVFQNPQIIQKLSKFKSNQNSILISQVDNLQDAQQNQYSPRRKNASQQKIVIKTDQSIECIDQIHKFETEFYRDFFQEGSNKKTGNFLNNNKNGFFRKSKQKQQQNNDNSNTLLLIETYVKLLNAPEEEKSQRKSPYDYDDLDKNSSNVNQRVDVYDGTSHMRMSDFQRVERLLDSSGSKRGKQKDSQYNQYEQNSKIKHDEKDMRSSVERILDMENESQIVEEMMYSLTRPMWKSPAQIQSPSKEEKDAWLKQNIYVKRVESREQKQGEGDVQWQEQVVKQVQYQHSQQAQDSHSELKPFMSSQMGRQLYEKQNTNSSEERARLNQLKKHEIQKWTCLLEYIKSNMNSETNTQEVLEQVYEYLSQAKLDLIKEGQNIVSGRGQPNDANLNTKQRLEEQFTNRLSSQLDKSQPQSNTKINKKNQDFSQEIINRDNFLQSSQNRQKTQEEEIGDEEAKSFKEDYQSQQEESIKFMNLSTIETALRNRFNQLTYKKDKQLAKLQTLLQQNKLTSQQYDQQKTLIQAQFKKQTTQILNVKKNIWKGYNEAKGILDKSYINSRIEQEFRGHLQHSGKFSNSRSVNKDRKMMKCLSESYLNRKKIDYKKFIEQEEKKREEEHDQSAMRRQYGQVFDNDDDVDSDQQQDQHQDQHMLEDQLSQYPRRENIRSRDNGRHDYQSDSQQYEEEDVTQSRCKFGPDQESNIRSQTSDYSQSVAVQSTQKVSKDKQFLNKSVDEQFQKISRKLNKLKQQHQSVNFAQSLNNHSPSSPESETMYYDRTQENQQQINEFNPHQLDAKKIYEKQGHSPVMVSITPESSVHYEEVEKDLQTESDKDSANYDEKSRSGSEQGDYIDQGQDFGEVKHSSDEEDKSLDDDDRGQLDSEEEEKIIARELAASANSLSNTKSAQPLKSTLQQLKQSEHLTQPKPGKSPSQPSKQAASPQNQQKQMSPQVLALVKKLKYLTEQDRQDIFEFMFLDLCIELYQQPCHDNKLMNTINKYVAKQHQMAKRKKGFKTNLNVVKDYLKRFCGYLLRTNKHVLQNVNVPMGPTAIQMLRYMHDNDQLVDDPIDGQDGVVTLIVPVHVFDAFERSLLPTLQFQNYYDNQEKQQQRVNFLKTVFHIHNKALFDALNEFLDQQRPFGIWGKPFPWKKSSSFTHKFTEIQQEQKLKKSAQKVVEACSYVCGLLVDKEESLVGNAKISEGYIQQLREDRISRMLANEMIENQERWVFYDDQQTEVLVQSGNYIYNMILREVVEDLSRLKERDLAC